MLNLLMQTFLTGRLFVFVFEQAAHKSQNTTIKNTATESSQEAALYHPKAMFAQKIPSVPAQSIIHNNNNYADQYFR